MPIIITKEQSKVKGLGIQYRVTYTDKPNHNGLGSNREEMQKYAAYLWLRFGGEVTDKTKREEDGEVLDACWGYYVTSDENEEYLRQEARSSAKLHSDGLLKERAEQFTHDTQEQIPA